MKNKINKFKILPVILFSVFLFSCEGFLEEKVYTEYDPSEFLKDQSGVDALLTGAYSAASITTWAHMEVVFILGEFNTDMTWETGGGVNRRVLPLMNFTWDPSTDYFNIYYSKFYSAIARANNVLSVADDVEGLNQETIDQIQGEARFIRAFAYYILHNLFGPTPIIKIEEGVSLDEIEAIGKETPRANEEEYRNYVEADLLFAAEKLKEGGLSSRANKGSALALLSKFYLNNKQWQKAAEAANQVLAMNYELYDDYTKLFAVEGENNKEFIFRFECEVSSSKTNVYMPHAFPPNYPILSNWVNFGAQYRTYTSFFETFEDEDIRRELLITEYVEQGKSEVTPLNRDKQGNPLDNVRSFKYFPDPNAIGENSGNDIPYIRLTDMMLSRAEALNELNGPTQEVIDLIMQVRNRANASAVTLADFSTKEALRDFILAERGREFYSEGLRREDLIRHGKFIERAIERGKNAKPYHVLYPIPQAQLDNNPNLEQNPGY